MKRVFAWCNLLLMALLLTACGGGGGDDDGSSSPKEVTIVSLQVTPVQAKIPHGLQQKFRVQAVMSDESVQDMTTNPTLSWRSDDMTTAIVTRDEREGSGLVVGVKPGHTNISASVIVKDATYVGNTEVEVTDAVVTHLQLSPPTTSLAVGLEQRFTAMALLSDGRSWDLTDDPALTWFSNDASIATISNKAGQKGMVTGVKPGRVTITASGTAGGVGFSAMTELIVTDAVVTGLRLEPTTMSVPAGLGLSFTAKALTSDGRSQTVTDHVTLNWISSDPAIATVSNEPGSKGRVTGKKPGIVTITATANVNGSDLDAKAELTVTEAVVTGVQVAPSSKSIAQGLSQKFTATALLSDGHSQDVSDRPELSWSSRNQDTATVSNTAGSKGLVTGVNVGRVDIIAKINGSSLSGAAEVRVTDAVVTEVQLSSPSDSLPLGLDMQFTATGVLSNGRPQPLTTHQDLSWSSSDPEIASISNAADSKGLAVGVSKGEVTIIASGSINGISFRETLPLEVTNAVVNGLKLEPDSGSVPKGMDLELTAKALVSDGDWVVVTANTAVKWSSDHPNIASVGLSADGKKVLVKGLAMGDATIRASGESNGKKFEATAAVRVTDAIVTKLLVTPEEMTLPLGLQESFTANALLSDGNKKNLTGDPSLSWTVGDQNIVAISASGEVSGLSIGETTVTASATVDGKPFNESAKVDVIDAVVTSLAIMTTGNLVEKFDKQYIAEATMSDGPPRAVTTDPDLSWTSSNTAVATVSNEAGKKGLVHGIKAGTAKITATGTFYGETFSDVKDLTVTACDTRGTGDSTVTADGLIFSRPLVKCEAEGYGIRSTTFTHEKSKDYVTITGTAAASACASMGNGYRLPTEDELSALYLDQGNMSVNHGWPVKNVYWSSTTANYADTYYVVDMTTGGVNFHHHDFARYVSCVRPSAF